MRELQFPHPMSKFMTLFWLGYLSALSATILAFLIPIKQFIILCTCLVIVDAVTGVIAARKAGNKIVSRGFWRTVVKFLVYFLAILSAEGMRVTFEDSIPLTYVVSFAICVTEFFSVLENVEKITGAKILGPVKGLFRRSKNH